MNLQPLTQAAAIASGEIVSIPVFRFLKGKEGQPEETVGNEGKTKETLCQPKDEFQKPMLYLDHEIE